LPQVTAVGGTSLGIRKNGRRAFEVAWASTASLLIGGAWVPPFPGLFLAGGGGGASSLYARPDYQEGVVPDALAQRGGAFERVVPDVSLIGNNLTGFLVGLTQTFPDGVYYDEFPVGGTSLGTPLLAALVALAEQKRGGRVGFVNPTLYKMRRKLVRDVVPEEIAPGAASLYANGVDATAGLITAAATLDTELQTLHTTQGYDATSGLGVPRVRQFIRRFGKR
jgi:subtilase family serine protease